MKVIHRFLLPGSALPIISVGIVFLFLLGTKLQLGQVRYFDADELAYLHWAHNVFDGRVPYRDFLSYVPPVYFYVLSLLFWVTSGVTILSGARILAFFIFLLLCLGISLLFFQARNKPYAILAAVILAFLPMPADKFIEIRPDNLAMLVVLGGLLVHGIALSGNERSRYWGIAGLLYGTSLLILPKTLPQVAIGVFVTILWWLFAEGAKRAKNHRVLTLLGSGIIPFLFFGLWVLFHMGLAGFDTVFYSLLRLPLEVNRLGVQFPLQPDLFFYPNTVLYGQEGWKSSLIVTHVLWLIGIFTASFRLVTPFIAGGKKGVYRELLIAGTFFAYTVTFIYGYPMRHSQYLIPVAIFISFYTADFVSLVLTRCEKNVVCKSIASIVGIAVFWMAVQLNATTTEAKLRYTNTEDYAVLSYAVQHIPKGSYVFDLVGSTIYFRDPFYVSAVPFGQWMPFVTRPFGSVIDALQHTDTRYVYEGRLGRLETLPHKTSTYMRTTFREVPDISGLYSR